MKDASQSPLLQEDGLFRSKPHLQFYRDVIATHLGSTMLGNDEQAHLEFKSKNQKEIGKFLEELIIESTTAFSERIVEQCKVSNSVED